MLRVRLVLAILLLVASAALAQDPFVWDQSDFSICCTYDIHNYSVANDFTLAAMQDVVAVDLFLLDGDGVADGVFGSFSGIIGWAIYDDAASGHPGNLIDAGTDISPVVTDTLLDFAADEVFRVRITLSPPQTLAAGHWWLAIHEGPWGEGRGSAVIPPTEWINSYTDLGMPREAGTYAPGAWSPLLGDSSFVVYGVTPESVPELIFASGFEAGVACAWDPSALYVLCP